MTTTISTWKRILHRWLPLLLLALAATTAHAEFDERLFAGLKARSIGPAAVGGRIAAIDAVAADPNRIVIGAATGGVWLSSNGGLNWTPVFDDEAVASIGAIAIDQSNPDVIWVGTGESNVRNSTSIGGGVFKSIDGGRSWQLMGLEASERIDRIALHPDNPDIAYVAAMGTLWGPNEERGIYKTVDGGETWARILYVDEKTGATDIRMDPSNPDKLYAAMWQFRRWPYQFSSGGPGSGMYISYDAGRSWNLKTEEDGLPAGELGRIVFATSAAEPKRVYALVEAKKSALLVSRDGGEAWSKVNEEYNVADRPFYYSEIAVDPSNANRVYNIATRVRVSIDGGKTFEYIESIDCCAPGNTIHIDNHAWWINPGDARHMIVGNDGGLAITRDRGETWRFVRNLPLAQFYHVAVDDDHPYHVYGGLQDNGAWRGPAEIWANAGIQNLHWQEVGFGDGFDTRAYPDNPRAGYTMSQGGALNRWNLDTGEQRFIMPGPPSADVTLRFNWNAGFAQDPFDADTIYYGSQFLHKSEDRGESWQTISADLTSDDAGMQTFRDSGGITLDVTAAENYTTITAVAASPLQQNLLWVGTDDGRLHVTEDGGQNWRRIDERARGVPAGAWVPMIAPSPHEAGSAYVVFDDHRRSNMQTYVYRVSDFGGRWQSIGTDELSGYALSVLQDPVDPDLLFLGTEFGLFVSTDGGDEWMKFKAGVPTVSVMDMAIQERESDLVLGTHGRSIYVIDDYRALRGLDEAAFDARLEILSVAEGQQYDDDMTRSTRFTGAGEFRGDNEPYGVLLTFIASGDDLAHPDEDSERERKIRRRNALPVNDEDAEGGDTKEDDAIKVTVEVSDAQGDVVRRFRVPAHQGINRVAWDMRRDGAREMPGDEERDYEDGLPAGPLLPPGDFPTTLSLPSADGDEAVVVSTSARTVPDPRSPYTAAERQQNFEAQTRLLQMRETAVSAVERIVETRDDVNAIKSRLEKRKSDENDYAGLIERADALVEVLDRLEKTFRVPPQTTGIVFADDKVMSRIDQVDSFLSSTWAAPGSTAKAYMDLARETLDDAVSDVNALIADDLRSFRTDVSAAGIGLLMDVQPIGTSN